jgi:uncharacterized protein YkwD
VSVQAAPERLPLHEHPTIIGLHDYTQKFRASNGRFRQSIDPQLCVSAQLWAVSMRDSSRGKSWDFIFTHHWPGTEIHQSHDPHWISVRGAGENTGGGVGSATISRIAAFDESPGHRHTMLKPFRRVGYGYAKDVINGIPRWYVAVRYRLE